MTSKLNKLIGEDLTIKMKEKGVSDYYIHRTLKLCSQDRLKKIKEGRHDRIVPLRVIINIYKALGESSIFIDNDKTSLLINF